VLEWQGASYNPARTCRLILGMVTGVPGDVAGNVGDVVVRRNTLVVRLEELQLLEPRVEDLELR